MVATKTVLIHLDHITVLVTQASRFLLIIKHVKVCVLLLFITFIALGCKEAPQQTQDVILTSDLSQVLTSDDGRKNGWI
jgi:hypothetical protein